MARDDYEVLLYKLLKYLFTCLKKDKDPQISEIAPRTKMFPISKRYFDLLVRSAYKEGLIENIIITELDGENPIVFVKDNINITAEGIKYLSHNSVMKQIENTMPEIVGLVYRLVKVII